MDGEEKFCDKQTCFQEIMLDHEDKKGKLQKDPMVEITDTSSTLAVTFPQSLDRSYLVGWNQGRGKQIGFVSWS